VPLSSWEMCGLSGESGADFREFNPCLRMASCVTDFLVIGNAWNFLKTNLSSLLDTTSSKSVDDSYGQ